MLLVIQFLADYNEINMLMKTTIKTRIKEIKELLTVYTASLVLFNLSFGQITAAFEPVIRAGR